MAMQTFTPIQYLQIDIASNFGLDKEDWDDRLIWFAQHESELETLVEQAEEPALFFAGVQAYRKAKAGQSIGYPISLDATASGAQILALLVGCEKSAAMCNVIDTGNRKDFYTESYRHMLDRVQDTAKIDRSMLKAAIMPWFYNSKALPKRVFGEGELLQIFYETMEAEAPGIYRLNEAFLELWQPDALSHDWVLPDNFHVKTKVEDEVVETFMLLNMPRELIRKVNQPTPEGRSIGANVTHSIDGMVVREMLRRCHYSRDMLLALMEDMTRTESFGTSEHRGKDKLVMSLWGHYQRTGFLSARILENLDAQNLGHVDQVVIQELINTLPDSPFPILTVHDCFRVHPNYGNDLRRQYNRILYEIARSELLADIVSQIRGEPTQINKLGSLAEDVLEANYALS